MTQAIPDPLSVVLVLTALGALACANPPLDHPGDMGVVWAASKAGTPHGGVSVVAASETHLVYGHWRGLMLYDLVDPRVPVLSSERLTAGGLHAAFDDEGTLHVGGVGYSAVDVQGVPTTLRGTGDARGWSDLVVRDGRVYGITENNFAEVVDATSAVTLTHLPLEDYTCFKAMPDPAHQVLYVACTYALHVIDLADPSQARVIGRLEGTGSAGLYVAGDLLYTLSIGDLRVVDVSDPTAPTLLGQYPVHIDHTDLIATNFTDIKELNGALYIGANGGLVQTDLSDPEVPVFTHLLRVPQVTGIAVANDLLYVAGYEDNWVVDPVAGASR